MKNETLPEVYKAIQCEIRRKWEQKYPNETKLKNISKNVFSHLSLISNIEITKSS